MSETVSEKRWAANEVVFRNANKNIQDELARLKFSLAHDSNSTLEIDTDAPLYFICECADEDCHQRILLRPSKYEKLHKNASQFVVLPEHTVASIEREIHKADTYVVVEKFLRPPATVADLSPTPIHNI